MSGALIDPKGHAPVALDGDEFDRLRMYLDILRSDDESGWRAAGYLLYCAKQEPGLSFLALAQNLIYLHLSEQFQDGEYTGILAGRFPRDPASVLSPGELEVLQNTLATLRAGSWFADWLSAKVEAIASATLPADRCPTPLQVMSSLTLEAEEFEAKVEVALELAKLRPDLFKEPPAAEPPATQEPQAPPGSSKDSSEPPKASKPRSTPAKKSRRKAA